MDLLKEKPGMSVIELSQHFSFSRYALMKHLRVLEKAELLKIRRSWKFKYLSVSAGPLREIWEQWLSRYQELWQEGQ